MDTALWILTWVLAAGYLAGALAMLFMPKERFRSISGGQHYADDFSEGFIKGIGALKLIAVAGLILPGLTGIAPVLVPLAALGLVLLMTGAATVRIVRQEWRYLAGDIVFLLLLGFLAYGRFALEPLQAAAA
jgi:hypothetical protein